MAQSNGELIAKARQMAEDVGRRAATRRRGARAARACRSVRRLTRDRRSQRRQGPRPDPPAARAASARCCSPTSAPRCSRSRTPGWATTSAGRRPTTATRSSRRSAPARPSTWRSTAASARSASTSSPRRAARRCCAWSSDYDVVLDGFRPGVLDRLGVGYERDARGQPGDRLLRDHRLRPGRPEHRSAPATT